MTVKNAKIRTQKLFVTKSVVTHRFKGLLLNCLYAWQLVRGERNEAWAFFCIKDILRYF